MEYTIVKSVKIFCKKSQSKKPTELSPMKNVISIDEFMDKYSRLQHSLFAFALKLTQNQDDAKDLMQDTLVRAFTYRSRFRKGTNFRAWISTIMRNAFISEYRKRKRRGEMEESIETVMHMVQDKASGTASDQTAHLKDLIGIIDQLDSKYRLPFLMFLNGFSYIEISQHFDIPIGTVKSRLSTARDRLRHKIKASHKIRRA